MRLNKFRPFHPDIDCQQKSLETDAESAKVGVHVHRENHFRQTPDRTLNRLFAFRESPGHRPVVTRMRSQSRLTLILRPHASVLRKSSQPVVPGSMLFRIQDGCQWPTMQLA